MNTANLLEAVRVVKENERVASDFYANAAKKTGSPLGKDLFNQLSEFEHFHFARLEILEKSLEEKGGYTDYEGKEMPLPPSLSPQADEEPNHQTVVNIIDQAINLEKLAEKTYADLANQIADTQGHAMFVRLSEEEHKHYRLLMEAYWSLSNMQKWNWYKG